MATDSSRRRLLLSISMLFLCSACQQVPQVSVPGLQFVPAPAPVALVPALAERRILLTVQFGFDQYTIRSDSFGTLNNLAIALNDPHLRGLSYEINGHTDLKGNFSHNIALSALRAKSVSDYLRGHGVLTPPIRAQGFGPLQLLYPTEPYNPGNRRVEVVAIGP
jgi:outer membrane protein OmpA-like peptidoglycan-associated protein